MGENMELIYEETGEVRPPRAGEWFRTPRGGEERARFDFSIQELPILREVFRPALNTERDASDG